MDKRVAYRMVRSAIASGALVRPSSCERCGCTPGVASDGRSKIQAHHADYSKPLDVEWICAKCHREETPLPAKPGAPTSGERNGQAKLSCQDVVSARRLRDQGMVYRVIAERFGVDKRTIMRAIKGEQWAHVSAAPAAQQSAPEWIDPVALSSCGPVYDAGWRDGVAEAKRLNERVVPTSAPERVSVPVELLERVTTWREGDEGDSGRSELRALLASHGRGEA